MGKLIVLGGPSCSGKTSIKKKLISMFPIKLKSLITCTTREKRDLEEHGVDYYFLSFDDFNWNTYKDFFAEQTEYAGHKYGVLKKTLDDVKKNLFFTVAIMDLSGIKKITDYLGKENVVSFYIDVSEKTISERLKKRGTSKEEINKRIEKALVEEMKDDYKKQFDFIVENEKQSIDSAVFIIVDKLMNL